ncbi:MAG: hypothetical protein PVF53_11220 [Desulfobacterales bacterium]|jgi:hypothetical protein
MKENIKSSFRIAKKIDTIYEENASYIGMKENIKSSFRIVKKFDTIYEENASHYDLKEDFYGIPRIDKDPDDFNIKYSGTDRDPVFIPKYTFIGKLFRKIFSKPMNNIRARNFYSKLEKKQEAFLHDIYRLNDAINLLDLLEEKERYEIIWVKINDSSIKTPRGFISMGFEPTWFPGQFSALCDCMFIQKWHGTDPDGSLFLDYYKKLNEYGLFKNENECSDFTKYYESFEWTERGPYQITEIFRFSNRPIQTN